MSTLLKPMDLNMLSSEAEAAKMDEERKLKKNKAQKNLELRDAFMKRDVSPEVFERINMAVSTAAKLGQHQIQVITFPASYCSDGGRRINIADPEWPSTLEGFAKRAFEFFDKELRPLGYKLGAEIINFPGGMPGEVGLYLRW